MNQNTPITSSQLSDVSLANFPFLAEGALSALSRRLQLSMKEFGLHLCQIYYRAQGRDPSFEELFLLDSIVQRRCESPDALLLSEFTTESDEIAETFADMLKRRTAAQRKKSRPLSFDTVASLMETWLNVHDPKKKAEPEIRIAFSPYRDILLAMEGFRHAATSGNEAHDVSVGLRPGKYKPDAMRPRPGDYVYAILSDKEQTLPLSVLSEFVTSPSMANNVKKLGAIQNKALFPFLADMDVGMTLCTDKILPYEEDLLTALTRPLEGIVFIAPPESSADLLMDAQESGLQIRLLAKVNAEGAICFPVENGTAKLLLPFLHSMNFSQFCSPTVEVPYSGTANVTLSRLGICQLNGQPNALIKVDASGDASFRATLNSVIYAAALSVALGGDLTATHLASCLSLPSDRTGETLGAILGLYRGQAEFALRGNAPVLSVGPNRASEISVVTLSPLEAASTSPLAKGDGTSIYYLEPLYTKEGLPDFADLKKLYGYVGALIKDGKVLSIRPTGEDLISDLSAMCRNVTVEYLADAALSSHFGGFLIETAEEIQGVLVGKTEKIDKSEADS